MTPWALSLAQQLRSQHDIGAYFAIPTGNDVNGLPYQYVEFSCPMSTTDASNPALQLTLYFEFSWDTGIPNNWSQPYAAAPWQGGTRNVHTGAWNVPAFEFGIPIQNGLPATFARVRVDPMGNQATYGANLAAKSLGG